MITGFVLAVLLSCDPVLTLRFTPPRPAQGAYRVCTTEESLEEVRKQTPQELADINLPKDSPYARFGSIIQMDPLDVFGQAGSVDRGALARLYRGRRVRVIRGWVESPSQSATLTLLSPYPDASLSFLRPGTMVIIWSAAR